MEARRDSVKNGVHGGGGHGVEKQRLSGEMTKTAWELHVVSKMQVSWHTAASRSGEQH